jgi:hypothetical protein
LSDLQVGELIDALAAREVEFLVAGSVAAAAHGVTGIEPGDLDIVPATDPSNLERLSAALADLGAEAGADLGEWRRDEHGAFEWIQDGVARPIQPFDPERAASFDHFFRTPYGQLDVVPVVAGNHADLVRRAVQSSVDGRRAWVVHPLDLMATMSRPRRPKDASRLSQLREIAAATMETRPVPAGDCCDG